ncbi:gliding motility lipoprotein GldH [Labilibacter sediminis]|nr:gliding motility lipoprotein GldH [Labilibacter sediminis]
MLLARIVYLVLMILKKVAVTTEIKESAEENHLEMIRIKSNWFYALIFVFALLSCGPNEWYYSSVEVPANGWHKDTVAVFKSEISELNKACHVLVEVENNEYYAYSNIWLFLDAVSPSGNVQRDTLECILADEFGNWVGQGAFSKNHKSLHPYKINIRFPQSGLYTYYLVQGMRDTVLTGIEKVGIKIIEVK